MRSLHRVAVTGGFGLLAMAGVASSVAFACTPQARLTLPAPDGGTPSTEAHVPAGTTITIEARNFAYNPDPTHPQAGYSNPVFRWNGENGPHLGEGTNPEIVVSSVSDEWHPRWTVDLTIPAYATRSDKPYIIFGAQYKPDGKLHITGSLQVYVTRSTAEEHTGGGSTATDLPPAVPPPATTSEGGGAVGGNAAVAPATGRPAPASATTGPAATAGVTTPGTAAAAVGAGGSAAPAPSAAVGPAVPSSAARTVDPTLPVPVPAPNEIWSGLDKPVPATALLDAPDPVTGGGIPAGAVLLGLGALALAATGALTGQRRLAVARAARR